MAEQIQTNKIKEITEEFFDKITITISGVDVSVSPGKDNLTETVNISIQSDEPQILIGQGGQTLLEIQRLLKTILNKKLGILFYLNLDINNYKGKKIEYLRDMARTLADQAILSKQEKILPPMSSYERRIIHAELSKRTDVATESHGDGFDRHIVIKPN